MIPCILTLALVRSVEVTVELDRGAHPVSYAGARATDGLAVGQPTTLALPAGGFMRIR